MKVVGSGESLGAQRVSICTDHRDWRYMIAGIGGDLDVFSERIPRSGRCIYLENFGVCRQVSEGSGEGRAHQ
jgi:hypothetical protein